ncbi:putative membrane protein YfcA [Pseudacidovorax sp. 1753]|uniref:sulfite exporter TauE/SafE family protein n=1 Tax=Pseudacidovorax sp. 1753 TaxID=3156419 RepID=UPI003393FF3A
MSSTLFIVAMGAAAGGFVQGLSGFAFGLVAMSVWAWTLPPPLAAVLAVFGSLAGQLIAATAAGRRPVDLPRLWPLLAGGLAGVPLGMWLLPRIDAPLFKAGLGLLLVVWCPAMLMARRLPRVRGGRAADGLVGLAGGALGALGGLTGTLPTLWCQLRGMDRQAQRALIQNFNLIMLAVAAAGYAARGAVTAPMLPLLGVAAVSMLLPSLIGARLYHRLDEAQFRRLVLGLLTLSGLALLAGGLPSLLARWH